MKQHKFSRKGLTILVDLPESFNELTRNQLEIIAKHWFSAKGLEGSVALLMDLLPIPQKWKLEILPTEMHDLLVAGDSLGFMQKEGEYLTKQLIPSFRVGWRTYYGPSDDIDSLTGKEFAWADAAYYKYFFNKDEAALDDLVAILYRPYKGFKFLKNLFPEKNAGDCRVEFNEAAISIRKMHQAKLPLATKQAIAIFFHGCRAHLVSQYPEVFGTGRGPQKSAYEGFHVVMLPIAAKMVFGPLSEVEKRPIWDIMEYLKENSKSTKNGQ